jgi:molecular chaperone DnaK
MSVTIDFGIDLGTTNSLISKFSGGKIEIFKNPVGHKETLPSVVAFRKERVIVGDKAKEYVERDPENVFGSFKRKMGTTETFYVKNMDKPVTPIELSSFVLRELKNFVYTGETVDSVVITIPASFDTIQSNATKKAGYEAGFREVVLLQEPIAASLAYANSHADSQQPSGQWLVYDLGGGTFDVALVQIEEGEMKVIDHEGDNFLGGLDFDNLIIETFIIPHLQQKGKFTDLEYHLKSSKGRYNHLYYILLHKAEEAKVLLSMHPQTEIEFEIEDDAGKVHEIFFPISTTQFEESIRPRIDGTLTLIRSILTRNNIRASEIKHVLMVGGSTYIPLVRNMIQDELGMRIECGIDPTTAVAVGAGYYAGTRTKSRQAAAEKNNTPTRQGAAGISARMAYQKTSQDDEEYFTAQLDGDIDHLSYRIVREDGGFDSGLKKAEHRISEMLPLAKNTFNCFILKIVDAHNNPVNTNVQPIGILHGKFHVAGQPLPNDICLEVDDFENNITRLEVIFERNAILPVKKTITREISKTIQKGSQDSIIINVVEGDRFSSPASSQTIGTIEIRGNDMTRDLIKGSDIEITLEISESRDIKINTYLLMTDQEFSDVFSPSERHVNLNKLKKDIYELLLRAKRELLILQEQEKYEEAGGMKRVLDGLEELHHELRSLSEDDVTDARYQFEDRKRKLSRTFDVISGDTHSVEVKAGYFNAKAHCEDWVATKGNEQQKTELENILVNEKEILATNNKRAINMLKEQLQRLTWKISQRDPMYVISLFHYYSDMQTNRYRDEVKAKKIIEMGEKALERRNYDELLAIIYQLFDLLPPEQKDDFRIKGTGIG